MYNFTLQMQLLAANSLSQMVGSPFILALIVAFFIFVMMFIYNFPTDLKIAVAIFSVMILTAPVEFGGFSIVDASSIYFGAVAVVGSVIIFLALNRILRG